MDPSDDGAGPTTEATGVGAVSLGTRRQVFATAATIAILVVAVCASLWLAAVLVLDPGGPTRHATTIELQLGGAAGPVRLPGTCQPISYGFAQVEEGLIVSDSLARPSGRGSSDATTIALAFEARAGLDIPRPYLEVRVGGARYLADDLTAFDMYPDLPSSHGVVRFSHLALAQTAVGADTNGLSGDAAPLVGTFSWRCQ